MTAKRSLVSHSKMASPAFILRSVGIISCASITHAQGGMGTQPIQAMGTSVERPTKAIIDLGVNGSGRRLSTTIQRLTSLGGVSRHLSRTILPQRIRSLILVRTMGCGLVRIICQSVPVTDGPVQIARLWSFL